MVATDDLESDLVVDVGVVELLEVGTESIGDRLGHGSDTSSIVSESSFARTVLHDDLASQCLFILDADVVIVVTVLDLHLASDGGWSSGGTWLTSSVMLAGLRLTYEEKRRVSRRNENARVSSGVIRSSLLDTRGCTGNQISSVTKSSWRLLPQMEKRLQN